MSDPKLDHGASQDHAPEAGVGREVVEAMARAHYEKLPDRWNNKAVMIEWPNLSAGDRKNKQQAMRAALSLLPVREGWRAAVAEAAAYRRERYGDVPPEAFRVSEARLVRLLDAVIAAAPLPAAPHDGGKS